MRKTPHYFVHFFLIIGANKKKKQVLFFRHGKYFPLHRKTEICQIGYKQGKCTKTMPQNLVLLLKKMIKEQYF